MEFAPDRNQANGRRALEPGKYVLIVTDLEASAKTTEEYLAAKGFGCRVAQDGPAALREAAAETPAAILTDIRLPGMDGIELTRQIRSKARGRDMPVVVTTTRSDPAERVACLAAGATECMIKPLDYLLLGKILSGQPAATRP